MLTILAILLAESVPRFDLVMSIIGGSLTGPIVFVLPPMLYVKMLSLKREHEKRVKMEAIINIELTSDSETLLSEITPNVGYADSAKFCFVKQCISCVKSSRTQRILCFLTATFGICSLILTTYVNVINTVQYANFSQPCIYNLSFYI